MGSTGADAQILTARLVSGSTIRPAAGGPTARTGPRPNPAAARMLRLQRTVGNRAVAQLATAAPTVAPAGPGAAPVGADQKAGTATLRPVPADDEVVELYPIFDRVAGSRAWVNAQRYEEERVHLGRLLKYLAKAIPEDAKQVLEAYPFVEVKEMYQEVVESLTNAGRYFKDGRLVAAGFWAKDACRFTDIEVKAHKRFMQESALSYVGKRVGLAVIGFFEGAAEAMVGLVDTGLGLVGVHPDLEGKIAARYAVIRDAYSGATGIDHNLVHDAEIGRFGGRLAENLATGKALGGLGKVGTAINVVQAGAGVKAGIETVVTLRAQGKSWGDILGDPVNLAQFAGALAGVAGVGANIPALRSALHDAGLVLTGAQITALSVAFATYTDDPKLTDEQNLRRRADLLEGALTSAVFVGQDLAKPGPHPMSEPHGGPVEHPATTGHPSTAGHDPATRHAGAAGHPPTVHMSAGGEATATVHEGRSEVHVHDGEISVCPVQRCARATVVADRNRAATAEIQEAEKVARSDPAKAAADTAAALESADRSPSRPEWSEVDRAARAERRAKIAESVERRRRVAKEERRAKIADMVPKWRAGREAWAGITDRDMERWVRGLDTAAEPGKPGTTKLKRDPASRADLANTPLTAEQVALIRQRVAEMKARGELPRDYVYKPPDAPGMRVPIGIRQRVRELIGARLTDTPAVGECWRQAAEATLGGGTLTRANYAALYKSAQGRFWRLVAQNPAAKAYFVDHGFVVDGKRAAYLPTPGVDPQEVSLGLDHTMPKASGDNYRYALDGDKLQLLMQADNTKLSHIEKKDPNLARGDDD